MLSWYLTVFISHSLWEPIKSYFRIHNFTKLDFVRVVVWNHRVCSDPLLGSQQYFQQYITPSLLRAFLALASGSAATSVSFHLASHCASVFIADTSNFPDVHSHDALAGTPSLRQNAFRLVAVCVGHMFISTLHLNTQ